MDLDAIEEKATEYQKKVGAVEKKLLKFNFVLISQMIEYLIALWVYLWIYDNFGWHRCLIAIGVGVIVFGLRSKMKKAI